MVVFYTDRIFYQADTFFISQTLFRFWRQLWVSEILSARHFFLSGRHFVLSGRHFSLFGPGLIFYQADIFPFSASALALLHSSSSLVSIRFPDHPRLQFRAIPSLTNFGFRPPVVVFVFEGT